MDYRRAKRWSRAYARAHNLPVPKGPRVTRNRWGSYARQLCRTIQKHNGWEQTGIPDAKYINVVKPFNVKLMQVVRKELGTKEWPPSSNWGEVRKYLEAAGFKFPTAWCASFVFWCLHKAGWKRRYPDLKGWVPSWESWGGQLGMEVHKLRARKGDIVTFNWDSDSGGEHIGFILRNYGAVKQVATIEGNATSDSIPGGGVVKKTRLWSQVNHVYRLPRY